MEGPPRRFGEAACGERRSGDLPAEEDTSESTFRREVLGRPGGADRPEVQGKYGVLCTLFVVLVLKAALSHYTKSFVHLDILLEK